MPAKKFVVPFAATGNKTAVPNTLQPDGTVSYAQGFGPDYELDKTVDPVNAKDVPRAQTNQLYYDLTDAVGEQQLYGVALWGADRAPYPLNARAYHTGKLWRSNVANNSGEPGIVGWDDVSANRDYINAPIATVAAASTINLTTGAPDTSQIAISGTGVSINGFTVEANRAFLVKMTGATNTLVNSASLVTGTGADITVWAGDSFWIRSTAANIVEVLCGSFLSESATGTRGQTYQDFTGSRSSGVTYTNGTGRTIEVYVTIGASGSSETNTVEVGGVVVYSGDVGVGGQNEYLSFKVPAGTTYKVTVTPSILNRWVELR